MPGLFGKQCLIRRTGCGYLLLNAWLLIHGAPALAQSLDMVPSDLMPGAVLQDLQKKTVPTESRPDVEKQPVQAPVEGLPPEPPNTSEDSEEKVLIRDIQVQGITLLPSTAVEAIVSGYKNREVSFAELETLTEKLTALYREKGYVTSKVYIPPQKLQNDTLVLQALEGKVGKIDIQEGRFFKKRSVSPGVTLQPGDSFNIEILSLDLRRLNRNPDRTVSASLKPGEQTGETEVELEIEDRLPVHLTPTFDNLGRQSIGTKRYGILAEHTNLLGFGDQVLSSLSFTRKSFGIVNQYQLPLGHLGTTVGFEHAYSRLKLGDEFEPLDVQGRAVTYTPYISQEILNTKNQRLNADLAFDFINLDTDVLGTDFSHDRLRVLRPALTWESFDKGGRTYVRNEFGIGLDLFDGTIGDELAASRIGAGTKFFTYTGSFIRTQKLPFSSFGIMRVIGQVSPDRLVSSQQFQAGGAFTVRGYHEGELIGDRGLITSLEVRTPFYFIPKTWRIPGTQYSLRNNLQFVSFADYGSVYVNKPAPGIDDSEHILGLGLGIRAQLTKRLIGRVDWGFPVLKQTGNNSPRIHFGLQSNLF